LLNGAIAFTIEPTINNSIDMQINKLEFDSATSRDYRLFYNLGILYIKNNNPGKAIVNLKRANLLNPYDKQVYSVLTDSREKLGIPAYIFEGTFLEKAILFPFTMFHINATVAIGIIIFILGSIILSLVLSSIINKIPFLQNTKTNIKKIRRVAIILLIIGAVYITAGIIRHRFVFNIDMAVVVADNNTSEDIVLFQTPETNAKPIDTTSVGMECQIEDEREGGAGGAFLRINTIDGKVGWIDSKYIERLW
jgi:hypothetical protein